MSDLISREALLKSIEKDEPRNLRWITDQITNAPAIVQGEAKEYDDEREEIASEHLDDVIAWLQYRGLYDDVDYQNESPDFSEILTNHENVLIKQSASLQQPQEQDELVKKAVADALEEAAKICVEISAEHNDPFQSMRCANAIRALIKRNAEEGE